MKKMLFAEDAIERIKVILEETPCVQLKADELAEAASFSLNSFLFDQNAFVNTMSRQHRTIQQRFTKLCVAWLKRLAATSDGHYDERNEASVLFARSIKDKLDDSSFPFV